MIIAQVLINAQDVNIKMGEYFMVEVDLMEVHIQQHPILSLFLIIETIQAFMSKISLCEVPAQ